MACGRPPFVQGGVGMIIGSHIYEPVPRPRSLVAAVSPQLEALLLKALEKDPDARYQTMNELSLELGRLGDA
jgi:serine/threonine-protein kinase